MAELQIAVHEQTVPGLPLVDLREFARELQAVPLPSDLADADGVRADAIAHLAGLPAGDRVCHLDFHPANIIATARGPVIIDWPNARLGNPDADVARTVLILRLMPAHIPMTGAAREQAEAACAALLDAYLDRYRELRSISDASLRSCLLPLAVARYSEGLSQQHALLGALIAELRS
jgi:aminoglycoside phosphotransferase (APT) family kinase protein